MKTNVISRSLHDVGLSAWFGGTLANAVALNAAASAPSDPKEAGRVVEDSDGSGAAALTQFLTVSWNR